MNKRKSSAIILEKRPLWQKVLACALTLLVVTNIAPSSGFSVISFADNHTSGLIIDANNMLEWRDNGGELTSGSVPTSEGISEDAAKAAFLELVSKSGKSRRHTLSLSTGGYAHVAEASDSQSGDVYLYNDGNSDKTMQFVLSYGYAPNQGDADVFSPVITAATPIQAPKAEEAPPAQDKLPENDAEKLPEDGIEKLPENGTEKLPDEPSDENSEMLPELPSLSDSNEAADQESNDDSNNEYSNSDDSNNEPEAETETEADPLDEVDLQPANEGGDSAEVLGAYVNSRVLADVVEEPNELPQGISADEPVGEDDGESGEIVEPLASTISYDRIASAALAIDTTDSSTIVRVTVPGGAIARISFDVLQSQNPEEVAQAWLAEQENSLNSLFVSIAFMTGSSESQNNSVSTGGKFTIKPSVGLPKAPVTNNISLFTEYQKVRFSMKLPAGLKLSVSSNAQGVTLTGSITEGWTYSWQSSAEKRQQIVFPALEASVPSGSDVIGKSFSVSDITFEADFNVTDSTKIFTLKRMRSLDALPSITVTGDENWVVSKNVLKQNNADYTIRGNNVVVQYEVKIGIGNNNVPSDDRGVYDKTGRAGFQPGSFSVTETLPTFVRDNETITPISSKMTMYDKGKPTSESVTGGAGATTLTIQAHNNGPDGTLNNIEERMPYFTRYVVEVEYPKDKFVVPADAVGSYDGQFRLAASAALAYQPYGGAAKTATATADTTILITETGGTLVLEKMIEESGKVVPYDLEMTQFYLDGAKFQITATDGTGIPSGSANPVILPTKANPSHKISISLRPGKYKIKEIDAPTGTELNTEEKEFEITKEGSTTVTFVNKAPDMGGITFKKVDGEGKPLPQAIFTLNGMVNNKQYIRDSVSQADGTVMFTSLPAGNYTLTEKTAPTGYIRWTGSMEVTVAPGVVTAITNVPANIKNVQTLTLTKKVVPPGGTERALLKNEYLSFRFTIKGSDNSTVEKDLSQNGTVKFDLKTVDVNGQKITYTIEETIKGSSGDTYMTHEYDKWKTVPEYKPGAPWVTTAYNTYVGSLKVKKVVTSLEGTTVNANTAFAFELYKKVGDTLVLVPNSSLSLKHNESKSIGKLEANVDYYWYEVPVEGYNISSNNNPAPVTIDGKLVVLAGKSELIPTETVITNVPSKGRLTVEKQGEDERNKLAGAEFVIKQDGAADITGTTDSGGLWSVDLAPGRYTLTETKAPSFHLLDSAPKPFEITVKADGSPAVVKLIVTNRSNVRSLRINKSVVAPTGVTMPKEIEFEVHTSINGGAKTKMTPNLKIVITGTTGTAVTQLPYQDDSGNVFSYWLKEVKQDGIIAPKEEFIEVGVLNDDKVINVQNTMNRGSLQITKVAAVGGRVLKDATFKVTGGSLGADGKTAITDSNGIANFTDLPIFDAQGIRIVYAIEETKAPSGFVGSAEKITTSLKDDGTVTTKIVGTDGKEGAELKVQNAQGATIIAQKVQRSWGDQSGKTPLAGAEIGLYRLVNGTYTRIYSITTNAQGQSIFAQDNDQKPITPGKYAVVETKVPDGYTMPSGKIVAPSSTFLEADFALYNAAIVEVKVGDTYVTADPLVNEVPWAQFKLTKIEKDSPDTKLNLAEFALYSQTVADGATVEFAKNSAKFIENYTSGYVVGDSSPRQNGIVLTKAVKAGEVYYLVETTPAYGYSNVDMPIIAFVPEGKNIKVTGVTQTISYKTGEVTDAGNIGNTKDDGSGVGGKYAFTAILVDKVLKESATATEVTDFQGVTLALHLADAAGNPLKKLQEVVTGKDVTISGKTGMALFGPIDMRKLHAEYVAAGATNPITMTPGIGADINNPTFSAKFVITEISAPTPVTPPEARVFTVDTANRTGTDSVIDNTGNDLVLIDSSNTKSGSNGALVNFKLNLSNTTLVVTKYGYKPTGAATADALDAAVKQLLPSGAAVPLSGIEFNVDYYDVAAGSWKSYKNNQNKQQFTTDSSGKISIQVIPGRMHRVIETGGAATETSGKYVNRHNYDSLYAKDFFIDGTVPILLEYYNPEKPVISVVKNGGTITSGIKFILGTKTMTPPSGDSKAWTLPIVAGTHVFTESADAASDTVADGFPTNAKITVDKDGNVTIQNGGDRVKVIDNVVHVTNPVKGTLNIVKTDGTATIASSTGLTYNIRYLPADGTAKTVADFQKIAGTVTSNVTNGTYTSKMKPGWYYVAEKTAPTGYTLDTTPQVVELKDSGNVTLTFVNKAKAKLTVSKKFDLGGIADLPTKPTPPTNVTVDVYAATADGTQPDTSKKKGSLTIPANGEANTTLDQGTYFLKEISNNKEWALDSTKVTGGIFENGYVKVTLPTTETVGLVNKATAAYLKILKVDQDTNAPIKDVKFELRQGDKLISELMTDDKGITGMLLPNVPESGATFTLIETAAPAEYQEPDKTKNLLEGKTVLPGEVVEITVKNQKGIVINATKHITVNGQSTGTMDGVTLELLDASGNVLQSQVTTGGKATFGNLKSGTYQMREAGMMVQDKAFVLEKMTINASDATKASEDGKTYSLGELTALTNDVGVYNRKPQTLTVKKEALGDVAATAIASFKVTPTSAIGVEPAEGTEPAFNDGRQYASVAISLQPGFYLVEEIESNMTIDPTNPQTPTKQYIQIVSGEDATMTFKNAPKVTGIKTTLTKTATPEVIDGSLMDGEQTLTFVMSDFANGTTPLGIGIAELKDTGLKFYSDEAATKLASETPEYSLKSITVGEASYSRYVEGGSKDTMTDVSVTLKVDGVDKGTKSLGEKQTFTLSEGKQFELLYTVAGGTIGPDFKAGDVTVEYGIKQMTGSENADLIVSVVNEAEFRMGVGLEYTAVAKDNANVKFNFDISLPPMELQKLGETMDKGPVGIDGTIAYTLKLANKSTTQAIELPVVIDAMPKGVILDGSYQFSGGGGTPVISNFAMSSGQKFTQFAFKQPLPPGQTATISYTVKVLPEALLGGENPVLNNYAYATSLKRIASYKGNILGMSFTTVSDGGPVTVDPWEGTEGFIAAINNNLDGTFGYTTHAAQITVSQGDVLIPIKSVTTQRSGTISAESPNAKAGVGEEYTYMLTVVNGSGNPVTDLRVADILPRIDDGRQSNWGATLVPGSVTTTAGTGVNITYSNSNETALQVANNLEKGTLPSGSADGAKTIYIDFGKYSLPAKSSLQVTYRVKAPTFGANQVIPLYKSATNNFYVFEKGKNINTSNVVSVDLEPSSVEVGGFVWIDENGDGIANNNERANSDLATIISKSSIKMLDLQNGSAQHTLTIGSDGQFKRDSLTPAALKSGASNPYNNDYTINKGALEGSNPAVYSLQFNNLPSKDFSLTIPYAANNRYSQSNSANSLDATGKAVNHFRDANGTWTSEQFFLWPSESGSDLYKNIGITRYRGINVNKTDNTNGAKIAGAEFILYGPFSEEPTAENYKTANQQNGVTDANGKIEFSNALYYQYYVLEETKPAGGFTLDGAGAQGLKALTQTAWIIPKGSKTFSGTVDVTNVRSNTSLTVIKNVEGDSFLPTDNFTFKIMTKVGTELKMHSLTQDQVQNATVTDNMFTMPANVTATINGLPSGVEYAVQEVLPKGFTLKSIVYQPSSTPQILVPNGEAGEVNNHAIVTNVNNQTGAVTLSAKKVLENQTLAADQFSFQLKAADGTVLQTKKNDANGNVLFDTITYTRVQIGEHRYTISEVIPEEAQRKGITYDAAVHDVLVKVTENANDANALVTEIVYNAVDQNSIVFTNNYDAKIVVQLGAFKRTVGATLREGQFVFKLTGEGINMTARNLADGTVTFEPIGYTLADLKGQPNRTYTYNITEEPGNEYGYKYDTKTYTVTVVLTDNGDGTLKADATMNNAAFDPRNAEFVNTFSALSLDVYKYRDGNFNTSLNGANFSLYLYDANGPFARGALIGSGTTANGGRLRFENLSAGRYILLETRAPSGYDIIRSSYDLELSAGSTSQTFVNLINSSNATTNGSTVNIPNRRSSGGGTGGGGGGGGGGGDGGDGDGNLRTPLSRDPLTEIPDEAVPLAFPPSGLVEIPDEEVPLGALPNTGGLPAGALALLGGLMALLGVKIKKNNRKQS